MKWNPHLKTVCLWRPRCSIQTDAIGFFVRFHINGYASVRVGQGHPLLLRHKILTVLCMPMTVGYIKTGHQALWKWDMCARLVRNVNSISSNQWGWLLNKHTAWQRRIPGYVSSWPRWWYTSKLADTEEMGIKPETSHHEQGPGQNETTFLQRCAFGW